MSAIFLSYRRDDSSGYAGRLFDNLSERFGRERVFMDIETLEPGMDFVAGIDQAIDSCGAVIAMIGPNWINAKDAEGRPRLNDPHDFIRLEINSALTRGVRVIPVLVHHAVMPQSEQLPEPLRPLCRLQAFEISDNRWEYDVQRLGDVLEPLIAESPGEQAATAAARVTEGSSSLKTASGSRSGTWLALAAVVLLAAGGGGWWLMQSPALDPGPGPLTGNQRWATEAEPRAAAVPSPGINETPAPVEQPAAAELVPPEKDEQRSVVNQVDPVDERPVVEDRSPLRVEQQPTLSTPDAAPRPATVAVPAASIEPERVEPEMVDEAPPPVSSGPAASADPVPSQASADERRQRQIDELLQAAQADLAALRLTRPPGTNAFARYQHVLELSPGNSDALDGLAEIVDRYRRLVEDALDRGALSSAQRHLDAAQSIDADAAWINQSQREIERRRATASRPGIELAPSAGTAAIDRENCVSACRQKHQSCMATIGAPSHADCLARSEVTCEARYQACMSDTGKMFLGPLSHESECAGVHIQCMRAAANDCTTQIQGAGTQCDAQLNSCITTCDQEK